MSRAPSPSPATAATRHPPFCPLSGGSSSVRKKAINPSFAKKEECKIHELEMGKIHCKTVL